MQSWLVALTAPVQVQNDTILINKFSQQRNYEVIICVLGPKAESSQTWFPLWRSSLSGWGGSGKVKRDRSMYNNQNTVRV